MSALAGLPAGYRVRNKEVHREFVEPAAMAALGRPRLELTGD